MENNLKKCPKCGWEIANVATVCPNCGYNFLKSTAVKKKKLPQAGSGIAGMVLGLLALLLSCTPVGAPLAIFGFIFSCVGLSKKYYAHGTAVAGLTTSVIAIVIALIFVSNPDESNKDKKDSYIAEETETPKEEINNNKKSDDKKKAKKTPTPTEKPTAKPNTEEHKKKEYIRSCITYNYKKVLRNPDEYIGKRIREKVKISSVHEKSWLNSTKYYFAWSNDEYDMWCGDQYVIMDERSKQSPKLLEDDIIEVYGEIAEPEETVSLITNSSEVFAIDMKYVKLISE